MSLGQSIGTGIGRNLEIAVYAFGDRGNRVHFITGITRTTWKARDQRLLLLRMQELHDGLQLRFLRRKIAFFF